MCRVVLYRTCLSGSALVALRRISGCTANPFHSTHIPDEATWWPPQLSVHQVPLTTAGVTADRLAGVLSMTMRLTVAWYAPCRM